MIRIRALLFPTPRRGFPGKRWLGIALRTLHLVGVAGMGGGLLYDAPISSWQPYFWLTMGSGAALLTLEVWSSATVLCQWRGLAVILKLLLLGAVSLVPDHAGLLLVAVVVVSGVFSHAPATIRYYSPFHRRVLD